MLLYTKKKKNERKLDGFFAVNMAPLTQLSRHGGQVANSYRKAPGPESNPQPSCGSATMAPPCRLKKEQAKINKKL